MTALASIAPLNAFDTLVERLITAANRGEDFYQEAISAGLDMVDVDTRLRFCCGDIACLIGSQYGQDRMGEWAKHIKRARSTVYEMASVARFYPREMRETWLNEPAISWSHMRRAMRTKSLEAAVDLLDRAAEGAWSVEEMDFNMGQAEGKVTPERKVYNAYMTVGRVYPMGDFECLPGEKIEGLETGKLYKMTLEEVPDETQI